MERHGSWHALLCSPRRTEAGATWIERCFERYGGPKQLLRDIDLDAAAFEGRDVTFVNICQRQRTTNAVAERSGSCLPDDLTVAVHGLVANRDGLGVVQDQRHHPRPHTLLTATEQGVTTHEGL